MYAGSPEVVTWERLSGGRRLPGIPDKSIFTEHRQH